MLLNDYLINEILKFLKRRDLIEFQQINRTFYEIISNGYGLNQVLEKKLTLCIDFINHKIIVHEHSKIIDLNLNFYNTWFSLSKIKYLRFWFVEMILSQKSDIKLIFNILPNIKHLWKDRYFNIRNLDADLNLNDYKFIFENLADECKILCYYIRFKN